MQVYENKNGSSEIILTHCSPEVRSDSIAPICWLTTSVWDLAENLLWMDNRSEMLELDRHLWENSKAFLSKQSKLNQL